MYCKVVAGQITVFVDVKTHYSVNLENQIVQ